MMTHGTVRKMTDGQRGDLTSTMAGAIPPDFSFEEAQAIIGDKGSFVAEIRAAFAKRRRARANAVPAFTVTVDYAKTVDEMIAEGKYDWKNPDITSKNFPVKAVESGAVEVSLIHFDRRISSDDAIKEIDKMGFRPAELPHLLAFGVENPNEQRKYPIVALGPVRRRSRGRRRVPGLWGDGSERSLDLRWFEDGWYPGDRFLALRK